MSIAEAQKFPRNEASSEWQELCGSEVLMRRLPTWCSLDRNAINSTHPLSALWDFKAPAPKCVSGILPNPSHLQVFPWDASLQHSFSSAIITWKTIQCSKAGFVNSISTGVSIPQVHNWKELWHMFLNETIKTLWHLDKTLENEVLCSTSKFSWRDSAEYYLQPK